MFRNLRAAAAFTHDALAVVLAWGLAYAFRFNFDVPLEFWRGAWAALYWLVPLFAALFHLLGLYRGLWRFASLRDMQQITLAAVGGSLLAVFLVFLFSVPFVPRSVLVMHPVLLVGIMAGSRFVFRSWREHRIYGWRRMRGEPAILVGQAEASDALIRALEHTGQWYAVALLDETEVGNTALHGIPIFSALDQLETFAQRFGARHVILIESKHTEPAWRRGVVNLASKAGLTVMAAPPYSDLLSGRSSMADLRQVELEDLLGRASVSLDNDGIADWLSDQVVLVTGAGGSIGAELCRQIARYKPRRLVLLDVSEFALYTIHQSLSTLFPDLVCPAWAADVRDQARLDEVFARERPMVVFHAAAYKHVPLMEHENAWQALRVNAWGTWLVTQAARRYGVERFVLISTDKAVNPTNVMGASKQLAERLCRHAQHGSQTAFVCVRFGNVLGSNGSVIPLFRSQISQGGPVTVTHPEMVRFFMTIPEAAQLVLQAGMMGQGGETFILDMGEPIRIADLARQMILLSGKTEVEVPIVFTGLRPGEKLYEELCLPDQMLLPTAHAKVNCLRISEQEKAMADVLDWLAQHVRDEKSIKEQLAACIEGYTRH